MDRYYYTVCVRFVPEVFSHQINGCIVWEDDL